MGAVPLNFAEILLIIGLGSLWFRKRYVGLLKNRKVYKRFFVQKSQVKLVEVEKELKEAKFAQLKIWRDNRSMLPMHPTIMKTGKNLPTE